MAPKDLNLNYFYSIEMDNEREEDDEIDLTSVQRASSIDSLEQNESNVESLRLISGCHKWINSHTKNNIRVENFPHFDKNSNFHHEKISLIMNKNQYTIEEDVDDLSNSSQIDLLSNHFDVQLQVNNGQLQQAIRYEVFSSLLSNDINTFKTNQSSQTIQPEMDMVNDERRTNGNSNGYSHQYNGNNNPNNNDGSYRRNGQTNGSSGGNGSSDGNGSNPNRNNNNSRRPDDGGSEDNDDDDDDETDENLARRLGFRPIDAETLRIINRLRSLTNRQSFDRRDFENVQYLIDELIHLQHLENRPQEHLEKIIDYLKLHRILRTKSQALLFIQERLPQRTNRLNNENNSNVFDIWRERERRARLDSKDSLEDEGQNSNGHQSRDTTEIYQSTTPVNNHSNSSRSKVKQMARNIDTKSVSSRTGGDYGRSLSPSPTNYSRGLHTETLVTRRNISPITSSLSSEQRRVREMIDRLESSSSDTKTTKKISTKKSFHDDHSDGSFNLKSTPSINRIIIRDNYDQHITNGNNNNNNSFVFRHRSPHGDITRFELDRDEIMNGGRRTASGTTIDDYVTSLLPGIETSISMVRDIRARLYEDDTALSRTDVDNIPVKVDVETLYILEQKSERRSLPTTVNNSIPDYGYNRSSTKTTSERHDFAMQTPPTSNIKPPNRPIGTQVETSIEQNTVAAQTTDSLHRPIKERQNIITTYDGEDDETSQVIRTTTTTTRYEIKRRHSSHHTSEDEDNGGNTGGETVVYIDEKDNFQLKRQASTEDIPEQSSSFGQVTSRLRIDQLRDINRNAVRRHVEQRDTDIDEHRSSEVYEIHTRGACKCLVVSYEEKTQYGSETRFEKQLKRIERTYTDEELRSTELHVIVTKSDGDYQLVRRDYGASISYDDDKFDKSRQPTITINYYTKEGHRMRTEQARHLEHLPLFIRCEIEYELNHYGSAQLIILSVTNAERRQMNTSVKKETVNEIIARTSGRLAPNSPELEQEITRKLAEPISLLHLVDYSSRDDYTQTNSTDLRRVSRTDVSTSLRLVQRYRTVIHRLCQLYRSHLRLTAQAEQQRHLILVSRDEYYLLDLASQTSSLLTHKTDIQQRQHDIFKREVQNVTHQPFDYAKYRRDREQQQRILEQHYKKTQSGPPPGHPSEAEFYLGAGRRALIEREIHSMRESIRPHEHAPPRYKHEPRRRTVSISYSGGQRYVRARIIHVKDYYDESQQRQTQLLPPPQQQQQNAKEQELFVRVDDYINESAANSLRRSYSTDYLQEDGPRSRIRYIRIPGETIRVEEKDTYEYQGVMYADLPYSLRYWNILYILDREAREGRPLGSSLPHVIVNDPYRTVIPPLTQQEIRQTAQQVLSPQYLPRSYTDQTLRWFLSRDNRTEIESAKYLQTLHQYRQQQQHDQHKESHVRIQGGGRQGVAKKYFVTEKLVRYEKMPDRLVPVPVTDRAQSIDNLHHRSSSTSRTNHQSFHSQNHLDRSQSQPRPQFQPSTSSFTPNYRTQLPPMNTPLSRHQSVHELHATSTLSHPPSPSPSLHSLHSNYQHQHHHQHRRPVAFHNRYQPRCPMQEQQQQNPMFTEIFDSQTGQRILTTSQEQLPTAVRGLLNKYNL